MSRIDATIVPAERLKSASIGKEAIGQQKEIAADIDVSAFSICRDFFAEIHFSNILLVFENPTLRTHAAVDALFNLAFYGDYLRLILPPPS
jgi:hypothetical protein